MTHYSCIDNYNSGVPVYINLYDTFSDGSGSDFIVRQIKGNLTKNDIKTICYIIGVGGQKSSHSGYINYFISGSNGAETLNKVSDFINK